MPAVGGFQAGFWSCNCVLVMEEASLNIQELYMPTRKTLNTDAAHPSAITRAHSL